MVECVRRVPVLFYIRYRALRREFERELGVKVRYF